MKTKLIAGLLLAAGCMFAGPRIAIGVGVGVPVAPYSYGYVAPAPAYVAPAPVAVVAPPMPGPGYTWVGGYWYGVGVHRVWRPGYWAAPRAGFYVRGFRR